MLPPDAGVRRKRRDVPRGGGRIHHAEVESRVEIVHVDAEWWRAATGGGGGGVYRESGGWEVGSEIEGYEEEREEDDDGEADEGRTGFPELFQGIHFRGFLCFPPFPFSLGWNESRGR